MQAIFYNVSESPLKINKTLENGTIKTIRLLNASNNLRFDCVVSSYNENMNYVHIPALHRFYFVKDITIQNNGLFILNLEVDVLTTYKTAILNANAVITESENIVNADNLDYESDTVETVTETAFDNPFNLSESDVLVTVQGNV